VRERVVPLRIVLADDHATVRQGLKLLIDSQSDMRVVGDAVRGDGLLLLVDALKPDIIVMDISMPGMSGLVSTRTLKRAHPELAIVTLTRHDENSYLQELLRAGASAYVLKQSAPTELLKAIRVVAEGGVYVDPSMTGQAAQGAMVRTATIADRPDATISERESAVLRLIAVGHSNREIATRLSISIKTVEVHKANALRKLQLSGRVDIVRYGALQGWLYDI
jgi:DNA-binding NarL/FixJ family response regulator